MIEVELPESTVAVVLVAHGNDGEVIARYAESADHVPAPRRQVVDALLRLAVKLDDQADALDTASLGGETT